MKAVRITFILYLVVLYITVFLIWGGYSVYPYGEQIFNAMLIGMYGLYPLHLFFFIYKYKAAKTSPFLPFYYLMNIATLIFVTVITFALLLFMSRDPA